MRLTAADEYLRCGTEGVGATADGGQRDGGTRGAHELPTGYRHVIRDVGVEMAKTTQGLDVQAVGARGNVRP